MSVKQVLKHKGSYVATISPNASLRELVDLLAEHRIGAVVVSSDDRTIDGIVSERDVVRAMCTTSDLVTVRADCRTLDLDTVKVSQIMTANVRTCAPDSSIDEVMSVMTERRMRHLPVVTPQDDGAEVMVGLVSIGDIVKARISDLETERTALVEYVTTGR